MKITEKITKYLGSINEGYTCPPALVDSKINVANHLKSIKEVGLGPIDPRQPNMDFWMDKGKKWGISEGDARSRLCLNCEHYLSTKEIVDCINNGSAKFFKASNLPIKPQLADVESKPVAYCVTRHITCSPTRTCDEQEMGGPIDDVKAMALKLHKTTGGLDVDELEDYL